MMTLEQARWMRDGLTKAIEQAESEGVDEIDLSSDLYESAKQELLDAIDDAEALEGE